MEGQEQLCLGQVTVSLATWVPGLGHCHHLYELFFFLHQSCLFYWNGVLFSFCQLP